MRKNVCLFCKKTFGNNGACYAHMRWCKKNENSIKKGKIWTDEERKKHSDIMKMKNSNVSRIYTPEQIEKFRINGKRINIEYWSKKKNREKQSKRMKEIVRKNPNSYTGCNVSGRVKNYDIVDGFGNNVKVKGTWELRVAEWLNRHRIKWTNKIKGIEYEWKNNKHLYYPDFYLSYYDIYIEVKGYETLRDKEKFKQFPYELIKLFKKEIDDLDSSLRILFVAG